MPGSPSRRRARLDRKNAGPTSLLIANMKKEPSRLDVLQGTLDLLVLKTLSAMGPLHGYGIARRIEQVSGDLLALSTRARSIRRCCGWSSRAG